MLRKLTQADLPQLALIEGTAQISPWSEEVFKRCFDVGSKGWGVDVNGGMVGFIFVLAQMDEAHILNLCVRPEYQRQGLGLRLLKHALLIVKAQGFAIAYLEVRKSNQPAISLYKNLGFKQIGQRKDYYLTAFSREDALVFALDLAE